MKMESIVSMAAQNIGTFRGVHIEQGCEEDAFCGGLNSLYVLFDDTADIELHAELERRLRAVKQLRGIGDGVSVEKALYIYRKPRGIAAEVHMWLWDDRFTDEDDEACRFAYDIDAWELEQLTRFYAAAYERELLRRFRG